MHIILLSPVRGKLLDIPCHHWRHWILPLLLFIILPAGLGGFAYYQGMQSGRAAIINHWKRDVVHQRRRIAFVSQENKAGLDALTHRLGRLQVHMNRLDALGSKLVALTGLDKHEFDFAQPPARGGPGDPAEGDPEPSHPIDVGEALEGLSDQLADRETELRALKSLIISRDVHRQIHPHGKPVKDAYITSYYGKRRDPFTGKPAFHPGIDLAGKAGTPVKAVGDGVVTFAGLDAGYGKLVAIYHGHGLLTRFGHNGKIEVKVGQLVKRGETIALMGSTGRSTGPHVHFEVDKNGKAINPIDYLRARK